MDVIGNNIANVNTTAYKSQNMVFSDLLYQQTQAASGANADTGAAVSTRDRSVSVPRRRRSTLPSPDRVTPSLRITRGT